MTVLQRAALLGLAAALAVPAMAQDKAADVYKAKCAACHGADGSKSTMGSKPLTDPDVQGMSAADLAGVISAGKGKMPAYKGKLTDAQINDLAAYVKTFKK
jgi:mono/diheme cytochrome c family protein